MGMEMEMNEEDTTAEEMMKMDMNMDMGQEANGAEGGARDDGEENNKVSLKLTEDD